MLGERCANGQCRNGGSHGLSWPLGSPFRFFCADHLPREWFRAAPGSAARGRPDTDQPGQENRRLL
jgi:hypothetical protein